MNAIHAYFEWMPLWYVVTSSFMLVITNVGSDSHGASIQRQSDMRKDTGPFLDAGGSFVRISHWTRLLILIGYQVDQRHGCLVQKGMPKPDGQLHKHKFLLGPVLVCSKRFSVVRHSSGLSSPRV